MMFEVGQRYLENLIGVPLVWFKAFDSHGESLAFPVIHDRRLSLGANFTDMYVFLLNDIR